MKSKLNSFLNCLRTDMMSIFALSKCKSFCCHKNGPHLPTLDTMSIFASSNIRQYKRFTKPSSFITNPWKVPDLY